VRGCGVGRLVVAFAIVEDSLTVRRIHPVVADIIGSGPAALHPIPPAAVFVELACPGLWCVDVLTLLVIGGLPLGVIYPENSQSDPLSWSRTAPEQIATLFATADAG
jgi:hypothetical protein